VAFHARKNTTLMLAVLIGVFSTTAPAMLRAARPGDEVLSHAVRPRFLKEYRTASRKPPSPVAPDRESAGCEAAETDDDDQDDEAPRLAFLGGLSSLREPSPPRGGVGIYGPPSHRASIPILLLCQRLDC
jgi:hypothetical protein